MRSVPNHDQLVQLRRALLDNAASLVDDASLLYENGRFPRAYALAALAGEELGKVYLCLDALLDPAGMDSRQFWLNWRHHGDKLDSMRAYAAAFIDDLNSLNVDELGRDSQRIGVHKLSAIYVDFDGREALEPLRVTRAEANTLLERVRLSVSHAHTTLSGVTVDVVATANALAPELEAFFDGLLAGKRPEDALADLRRFLRAAPTMSADEVRGFLRARATSTDP